MRDRPRQRALAGDFDDNSFYTFHNTALIDKTLSSGASKNTNGSVAMTAFGSLSSENWQIYYQQGRYFIRNYDYGDYQLGVSHDTNPQLLPRSGVLGQQWSIMQADNGGGWWLSNGDWGNGTYLGLVAGPSGSLVVPTLVTSAQAATTWTIEINTSAGQPRLDDMLQDVDGFEIAPSTSTATVIATASSTVTLTPTAYVPSSYSPAVPARSNLGALVGIVIGAVFGGLILFALLGFLIWSLSTKKGRFSKSNPYDERHVTNVPEHEKAVYTATEGAHIPAVSR